MVKSLRHMPIGVWLFAAAWLLIFLLPPLRRNSFKQWGFAPAHVFRTPVSSVIPPLNPSTASRKTISQQWFELQTKHWSAASADYRLKPLLNFSSKHPNNLWMKADILRLSTRGGVRIIEGFKDTLNKSQSVRRSWLTPGMMQQCIKVAEEGEKLDAENAFFPVMRALYQFSLGNEPQGWAALERAKSCQAFDDYTADETRRRVTIAEANGRLSVEDRWLVYSAAMFPHFAPLRSLTRAACWRAEQALKSGNKALALTRFELAMVIGRSMQKTPDTYITQLVGEACQGAVWSSVARALSASAKDEFAGDSYEERQEIRRRNVAAYVQFANSLGAGKIAAASHADVQAFISPQLRNKPFQHNSPLPLPIIRIATQGNWLAGWLAWIAWGGALVWALQKLTIGRAGPRLSRKWLHSGGIFSVACLSMIFVWATMHGAGNTLLFYWVSEDELTFTTEQMIQAESLPAASAFWLAAALFSVTWLVFTLNKASRAKHEQRQAHLTGPKSPSRWEVVHGVLYLLGLGLLAIILRFSARDFENSGLPWPWPLALALVPLTAALLMTARDWVIKPPFRKLETKEYFSPVVYGFVRSAEMLGAASGWLAATSTVAYLVVVLVIFLPRENLDHFVSNVIQNGEIPTMLAYAKK